MDVREATIHMEVASDSIAWAVQTFGVKARKPFGLRVVEHQVTFGLCCSFAHVHMHRAWDMGKRVEAVALAAL